MAQCCTFCCIYFRFIFLCVGRRGQGGGGSQSGPAERLCVAENGRVQPREAAAQTGRPDGEGPAPAGGELTLSLMFSADSCSNNVSYIDTLTVLLTIHFFA